MAVCQAVREWALANPHENALLYGSPVPGYHAPDDTVAPAIRDTVVFGAIVSAAYEAGALTPPDFCPPPPDSFARDAGFIREQIMPNLPDDIVTRALTAWTGLFGVVSFEVFGQFDNVIDDRASLFDHTMMCLGRLVGLPAPA